MADDGTIDRGKGRLKEAAGDLTDDQSLKNEGNGRQGERRSEEHHRRRRRQDQGRRQPQALTVGPCSEM